MRNAFGVDDGRIHKLDSSALAGVDDVVTAPAKIARAATGGNNNAAPVVPPATKAKIKNNISTASGSGQGGAGGPAIPGNGTEVTKALGEYGRSTRGAAPDGYKPPKGGPDIAKIRGKLAPFKDAAVAAAKAKK